jgi:nucleoside-diphosphate-sugar epimerase
MITDLEHTAFVTGGSGFVGGRLIRRLVGDGWSVRALARSKEAEARVESLGADAVRGDLDNGGALRAGAHGCHYAFHAAAQLGVTGDPKAFEHINVQGTKNVLDATRDAGVKRFVHVGTEAALLAGEPLLEADERTPLRPDSPAPYSATKAKAEIAALGASEHDVFETVSVRPRFVWGVGDTSLLPQIVEQARSGRWAWIGGGRHRTSTTHVDNTVEGLVVGALRGQPGNAYFVLDDDGPVVFREFVSELLSTQGVEAPSRSVPKVVARAVMEAGERLPLPGEPPLPRFAFWVASQDCILDDTKARTELGYVPIKDRATGMAELRGTLQDVVATGV